jgi:nucleotide-binding universal stress UspA family protein
MLQASRTAAETKGAIDFKEVVVYVDGRADGACGVEFAATLASEHAAHLTGVFIQPEPAVTPPEMFARGQGMRDVIADLQDERARIEAKGRVAFERAGQARGVRTEWRPVPYLRAHEWAVHARYGDLAVVVRPDPALPQGPPGLVEALVLTSGRPTIVLPPRCRSTAIHRVLVAWNARREATRAVADALPLLVHADVAEVLVVDGRGDLQGHGEEPGADVARYLARHDVGVEVRAMSSGGQDVGHVILGRAAAFGADLVVMGAYGHSQLSEWVFGGVTRTVLREAEVPVLMSR